jgi:hypothetical protein
MCLYPKLIKNKKYEKTKKNGGNIPAILDMRVLYVPVGCTKCIECRKQKAREWQVRLQEEIRKGTKGEFVTLTFSNESVKELIGVIKKESINIKGYELDNEIATVGVRRFLERWRKKYKKSVRHWLVTELGHNGTENIHMHGIIWTDKKEEIEKIWKYGYVYIGEWVNVETVNYIIKYIMKTDEKHKEYKSKILTSAGIGSGYENRMDAKRNKYKKNETIETYKTKSGHKLSLPIYYRNKIYSEEEREKLWIEKLDKKERWVLGKKIKIDDDGEIYYQVLEEARAKNNRLGYGSDAKDWERIEYEENRREMMQQKRINEEADLL